MTYLHEGLIEQAVNGVLSQICDFDVEFLISNDCSPDNTDIIVRGIIEKHPNSSWIRYVRHSVNLGAQSNFVWCINQCKSKYIALCEGDDFWTDPLKLTKQVGFLELNRDYVLSFHRVDILLKNGDLVSDFITVIPENYEERETLLSNSNYIHTPSVVFRNCVREFPDLYKLSPEGDYLLYVLLTRYGKIGYIQETMAVYRFDQGFLSRNKHNYFRNLVIVNLVALTLCDDEREVDILFRRNLGFIMSFYYNLPFKLVMRSLIRMPLRILKRLVKSFMKVGPLC